MPQTSQGGQPRKLILEQNEQQLQASTLDSYRHRAIVHSQKLTSVSAHQSYVYYKYISITGGEHN
jgi:hypothetical protein